MHKLLVKNLESKDKENKWENKKKHWEKDNKEIDFQNKELWEIIADIDKLNNINSN